MELTPRDIWFYTLLGVSMLFSGIVLGFNLFLPDILKFLFLLLGVVLAYAAYFAFKFDYLILPLIQQKSRTIKTGDRRYWFSPTGEVLITKIGGAYYSSIFLRIHSYYTYTDKSPEENVEFVKLWERAITVSEQPIKFSSVVLFIDRTTYINSILDKLNAAKENYEKAKTSNDPIKIERARGEVGMWSNILEHIKLAPSRSLLNVLVVSQKADNEETAVANVKSLANDIASSLSAILGMEVTRMNQNEIEKIIEPEGLIPLSEVVIK